MPATSTIPPQAPQRRRAYEFAWNDDLIAANQFEGILTTATEGVASGLDTQTEGTPIVVFNPLNIAREDIAEATVNFAGGNPKAVHVFAADGSEVPSQLEGNKVLFVAKVPSVGYAVFDVRRGESAAPQSPLKVTASSVENNRYRVRLDQNGDVASIFDKSLNKELLSAPMRLAITTDIPSIYPAWNMDYEQVEAPPRAYVGGAAKVRITENGPVRVSLEVTRETEGSRFTQTVSLSAGDAGNRVEFGNAIDWRGLTSNLKESIPFAASNPDATYNWEVGTIQRPMQRRASSRLPRTVGSISPIRPVPSAPPSSPTTRMVPTSPTTTRFASPWFAHPASRLPPTAVRLATPIRQIRTGAITSSYSESPVTRAIGALRKPIGRPTGSTIR